MVAIVLVATLFLGAAWFVWDETGSALMEAFSEIPGPTPDAGKPAHTMTVSPQPLTLTLSFVERLAPREEVLVTSPTSGKVARVHFEYGARVVAGEPLVELDTAQARRRHRAAQAEYLEARDRLRALENWAQSPEVTRLRRAVARAAREREAQIPIVAVHGRTGAFWVNVWDEEAQTSRRVPVEVGATTRHRAEIVRGVEPGDEVMVVSGG